jgi:hypothetical protein
MRISLTLVVIFSSISAWAMPVYNCDVTAIAKRTLLGQAATAWTKKLLLSPAFTNRVDFNETTLDLRVDAGGVIAGAVNNQPNFILRGDVMNGTFESAHHAGTITCDQEIQLPYVLQFKPWKQYFTIDPILSVGHIQRTVELSSVDYGLLCFLGDVKEVNNNLSLGFGVVGNIVNDYRIDFTWEAEDCVRWTGSSPDDSMCVEYRRNTRTKSVHNCNGEPDPRS